MPSVENFGGLGGRAAIPVARGAMMGSGGRSSSLETSNSQVKSRYDSHISYRCIVGIMARVLHSAFLHLREAREIMVRTDFNPPKFQNDPLPKKGEHRAGLDIAGSYVLTLRQPPKARKSRQEAAMVKSDHDVGGGND